MTKLKLLGDAIDAGASIALGNFDGLHCGHQSIFDQINGADNWAVISFSPFPRRFFDPDSPRFELMNAKVQSALIHEMNGAHAMIAFNADIAALSPDEFLDALMQAVAPSTIAIGADFRFGKGRTGDAERLVQWGATNDVETIVTPILHDGDLKISSTEIRNALIAGRLDDANAMLGRPHIINGIVAQGDQRGRDLGFPTANLYPETVLLPKFGIYATHVTIHGGAHNGQYLGASSLGIRPSFGINKPNFETFILDFDGDIYGQEISVELIDYVRPEEKFSDIDALINQMQTDVKNIRNTLGAIPSHAG